ncbi:MAG: SRPBCC domain-containing protein [Dyadobacter sp.]|uniref:SRPBCC family protein n=1 Tax=Dyadobacter sp. TaxID=1914288 RepID=UPI001B049493|nr:SRPBCC domain-containing protein [Dyadobacter sp.]MBO9611811.1 SRPBCC domain-containing protein [Dyadobacter sp.]
MNSERKQLFITHLFDAPVETVFQAWTDPEQLKHWYAPDGCTIEFRTIDVSPGGSFHSCIHDPVHGECWIKGTYLEVTPNRRLVFTMIMSDEAGNSVRSVAAGKSQDWPAHQTATVTFEELGAQTKVSIFQTVSEEEAMKTGAYQGWLKMLGRLSSLLVEI